MWHFKPLEVGNHAVFMFSSSRRHILVSLQIRASEHFSEYNLNCFWCTFYQIFFIKEKILYAILLILSSVQFSHSVLSDSLQPHGLQHARPPCPLPTPEIYLNSCPLSQWRHPTISSSVIPFSSCSQSFPGSGSFPMSQLFPSGGQSIGVSASTSVLPMTTQDWSPLGWTGWIFLQSKELSRVFSNTTVQKRQFWHPLHLA